MACESVLSTNRPQHLLKNERETSSPCKVEQNISVSTLSSQITCLKEPHLKEQRIRETVSQMSLPQNSPQEPRQHTSTNTHLKQPSLLNTLKKEVTSTNLCTEQHCLPTNLQNTCSQKQLLNETPEREVTLTETCLQRPPAENGQLPKVITNDSSSGHPLIEQLYRREISPENSCHEKLFHENSQTREITLTKRGLRQVPLENRLETELRNNNYLVQVSSENKEANGTQLGTSCPRQMSPNNKCSREVEPGSSCPGLKSSENGNASRNMLGNTPKQKNLKSISNSKGPLTEGHCLELLSSETSSTQMIDNMNINKFPSIAPLVHNGYERGTPLQNKLPSAASVIHYSSLSDPSLENIPSSADLSHLHSLGDLSLECRSTYVHTGTMVYPSLRTHSLSKGHCSVSPVSSYSIVKLSLDSNVISHIQTCCNSTETSVENRHSRIPLGTICGDGLGNSSLENKFNNSLGVNLDTSTSQDYKEYGESVAPTLLHDSLVEASQERKLSELHSENKMISNQSQSELSFECVTPTDTCTSYKFQVGFPEKQSSCTHIAITHDLVDTSLKKRLASCFFVRTA